MVKAPDPAQFNIFEDPRAQDEREARREKRVELRRKVIERHAERVALMNTPPTREQTRLSILRGFVDLYFREGADKIIYRPLDILAGQTLDQLARLRWSEAQAWMKEVRLNPRESEQYVQCSLLLDGKPSNRSK